MIVNAMAKGERWTTLSLELTGRSWIIPTSREIADHTCQSYHRTSSGAVTRFECSYEPAFTLLLRHSFGSDCVNSETYSAWLSMWWQKGGRHYPLHLRAGCASYQNQYRSGEPECCMQLYLTYFSCTPSEVRAWILAHKRVKYSILGTRKGTAEHSNQW